tara:strand:- start:213 stop:434 length:222 start_codon:yes stop_codon:yes gene_type:complete
MVYGTSYFPTRGDAYKYYRAQGVFSFQVDNKINDGEIWIGKPPGYLGHNARAFLQNDQGGSKRWFIAEDVRVG